jgi:hypothetical protein
MKYVILTFSGIDFKQIPENECGKMKKPPIFTATKRAS